MTYFTITTPADPSASNQAPITFTSVLGAPSHQQPPDGPAPPPPSRVPLRGRHASLPIMSACAAFAAPASAGATASFSFRRKALAGPGAAPMAVARSVRATAAAATGSEAAAAERYKARGVSADKEDVHAAGP